MVFHTGHNYIGSEHLLLGLLREGEGVAARVLENLGADPSNIRTQASSLCFLWVPSLFFSFFFGTLVGPGVSKLLEFIVITSFCFIL